MIGVSVWLVDLDPEADLYVGHYTLTTGMKKGSRYETGSCAEAVFPCLCVGLCVVSRCYRCSAMSLLGDRSPVFPIST